MASRLDLDCLDLAHALSRALAAHAAGVDVAVTEGALELRLRDVRLPPAGPIPLPKLSELRLRFVSEASGDAQHVVLAWEWSAARVPPLLMTSMKGVAASFLAERLARVPAISRAVVSLTAAKLILDPREIRIGAVRLGDVLDVESLSVPGRDGAAATLAGRHAGR